MMKSRKSIFADRFNNMGYYVETVQMHAEVDNNLVHLEIKGEKITKTFTMPKTAWALLNKMINEE
jgi:hypothetical protein